MSAVEKKGYMDKAGEDKIPELLTGARILETRPLWEKCFVEDSTDFVDYYYENKAKNNKCFVIRCDGRIRSMLFLTPYDICVHTDESGISAPLVYRTFYIVGVATQKEYRHRGFMTRLLYAAFDYMRAHKILFTFLMPADPAIYVPFGFHYIYERENYRLSPDISDSCPEVRIRQADDADCGMLAVFAMRRLAQRYRFYLKRDAAYYRLLLRELRSENGGIRLVYVGRRFVGYYLYAREREVFVQEALFESAYEQLLVGKGGLLFAEKEKEPVIMGKYLGSGEREEAGRIAGAQYAGESGGGEPGAGSGDDDTLRVLAQGGVQDGFINELV